MAFLNSGNRWENFWKKVNQEYSFSSFVQRKWSGSRRGLRLKKRPRVGTLFRDSYQFPAVKLRIVLGNVLNPQDSVFFLVNFGFTCLKPSSILDLLFARRGYLLRFLGRRGWSIAGHPSPYCLWHCRKQGLTRPTRTVTEGHQKEMGEYIHVFGRRCPHHADTRGSRAKIFLFYTMSKIHWGTRPRST